MAERDVKSKKIKKYRRPLNINIGMIIFGIIFIYVVICVVTYFSKSRIMPYVVVEGSLSTNNVYTGIALREEKIVTATQAGYVNYYASEGERVGVSNLVYTIDQTGQLADMLSASMAEEDSTLTDLDLAQMRNEIVNFTHSFTTEDFTSVYDFKSSMEGSLAKYANKNLMDSISKINATAAEGNLLVDYCYASDSGIVSYWMDGYEEYTPEMVTERTLSKKEYEKKQLINNELVEEGGQVYKVCTDENWKVVIPFDKERGLTLIEEEESYIKVKFLKNQYQAWGKMEMTENEEGESFMVLNFNNSMITFSQDRFLDIELIIHDETGLKIPNSSIVEMDFFLIEEDYVTKGGKNGNDGVLRQVPNEDGTLSSEFVEASVYNKEDGEYYLDNLSLRSGDILIKPESTETCVVSKKGSLIGVYNMNKGYADFRQIEILYQNEEYSIVKSNTTYGLNVYDNIVLDASLVNENDFLFE